MNIMLRVMMRFELHLHMVRCCSLTGALPAPRSPPYLLATYLCAAAIMSPAPAASFCLPPPVQLPTPSILPLCPLCLLVTAGAEEQL